MAASSAYFARECYMHFKPCATFTRNSKYAAYKRFETRMNKCLNHAHTDCAINLSGLEVQPSKYQKQIGSVALNGDESYSPYETDNLMKERAHP